MGFALLPPLNFPADDVSTGCQPINLVGRLIRSGIYPPYHLIEGRFSCSKHILTKRAGGLQRLCSGTSDKQMLRQQRMALRRGFFQQFHHPRPYPARVGWINDTARLRYGELGANCLVGKQPAIYDAKCDWGDTSAVPFKKEIGIGQKIIVACLNAGFLPLRLVINTKCLFFVNGTATEQFKQSPSFLIQATPSFAQTRLDELLDGTPKTFRISHYPVKNVPRVGIVGTLSFTFNLVGEQGRVLEAPLVPERRKCRAKSWEGTSGLPQPVELRVNPAQHAFPRPLDMFPDTIQGGGTCNERCNRAVLCQEF